MAWYPLTIRHDDGFLRVTERPLIQHVVDELNKLEEAKQASITSVIVIGFSDDRFAELAVKVNERSEYV